MRIDGITFIAYATLISLMLVPNQLAAQDAPEASPFAGDLWSRTKLTGDWGGLRTKLANRGVTIDVDLLQTYQGVVDGGRDQDGAYGGSADFVANADFGKLGLWPGGFLKLFGEVQFGNSINGDTGAVTAANTDALFPLPDGNDATLTGVIFTQFLSEWFGVFAGKIDTLDGDVTEFANARGKDDFLNSNFVFNPTTLRTTPYSALGGGAIALLPQDRGTVVFTVLDANGTPDEAGFDDAFDDGAVFSAEARVNVRPFGLQGHQLVGGTYSTKDFVLLDIDRRLFLRQLLTGAPITLPKADSSWSVYYNFDQFFYAEKDDPSQGIGLFGRIGFADEETSPIELFYSVGIGGKGVIPTRDADTFGLGFYYINVSDDLPSPFGLIEDGYGFEVFYNIAVTPWLHVTPDIQVIEPSLGTIDTAVVAGLRVKVDF